MLHYYIMLVECVILTSYIVKWCSLPTEYENQETKMR